MTATVLELTMSLDGFVAGPDPTVENPLGAGGERLHEWLYALPSWRTAHGLAEGDAESTVGDELYREQLERTGAVVMGRRMFSGGEGRWEGDEKADGWWGDEPPFGVPVFVLTHHPREPLEKRGTTFHFVVEGIEPALTRARSAAGARDVAIAGGASTGRQFLRAGLVDELHLHIAPTLLGGGVRLFEDLDPASIRLEPVRVDHAPLATHVRYRVVR
jgi:dihydrofolate reductase